MAAFKTGSGFFRVYNDGSSSVACRRHKPEAVLLFLEISKNSKSIF